MDKLQARIAYIADNYTEPITLHDAAAGRAYPPINTEKRGTTASKKARKPGSAFA